MPIPYHLTYELRRLRITLLDQACLAVEQTVQGLEPEQDIKPFLVFPGADGATSFHSLGSGRPSRQLVERNVRDQSALAAVLGTHGLKRDDARSEVFVLTCCSADGAVVFRTADLTRHPDRPPALGPWKQVEVGDDEHAGEYALAMHVGFANALRRDRGEPMLELPAI
jgi:hypothetical protein